MNIGYAARRFGIFVVVVLVAASLNFIIPKLAPGSPITSGLMQLQAESGGNTGNLAEIAAYYRKEYGLDQPLWRQYIDYLGAAIHGDLGVSFSHAPARVSTLIGQALPWTITLVGVATIIAFLIGSLIGALVAWRGSPTVLRATLPFFMVSSAIPYFLLGMVLLFLFGLVWRIFPLGGGIAYGMSASWSGAALLSMVRHAILPALSIVVASVGFWGLGMRAMMVTVTGEDYMLLADAKGLSAVRVFFRYAVRNALLPQFTALALSLGFVVSGSVLVEVIFSYPGVGYLLEQAITASDYPLIEGIVLILVVGLAASLLIVDLSYPLLDPRIQYGKR